MNKYKIQIIMYKIKETIKNNINKKLLDRYNRIKMWKNMLKNKK